MKIKKVKWKSHPILGDLELDFTNRLTGKPYETIIFAGENGTGKTTILETISTFLNGWTFEPFEYIEYIAENKILKAIEYTNPNLKDYYIMLDGDNQINMTTNKNNHDEKIDNNPLNIRFNGCVFSKARADYKTNKINSTTTKQLDIEKSNIDQEEDFTSLKQLIVDIQSQDYLDYTETNKLLGPNPKSWEEYYPSSKIFRFKNAFDRFFNKLEYDKVADENSEKNIFFNKNGKSISIDKLSTGEKQIVFRGIFLLKNSKILNDAVIFVDEPELSMHPKWQKNILKYYEDLFTESNSQKTQLFIATHSEHVVSYALKNKNSHLVIILNENNGLILSKKIDSPSVLPSITSAEINYLAYDITSNDYHIELYGYYQNKNNKNSVKSCDELIKNSPHYNPNIHNKHSSFNNTTYDTLPTFIRNAIDHPNSNNTFTEEELRTSTELLIKLCI
ncbi:MAG: AAA family ATPase [Bacteroidales bacterium]|nr:AAA family ATPase [Bacteroidales bacterium]